MDTNKKTFNFTLLFIIAYAVLAVLVIIYIWWPKGNDSIVSNSKFTYEDIDEKEKAIDIYKTKIISLLAEKYLNQLYHMDLPLVFLPYPPEALAHFQTTARQADAHHLLFLKLALYFCCDMTMPLH